MKAIISSSVLIVIIIEGIYAGMFILSKAAFDHGFNSFIFIFYRQAAATIFLIPFAFFFHWKNVPPLTLVTFCKIFLLSLCGITLSLDISGVGLVYTSATLAAATSNCLPVITFLMALLLRIEVLKVKSSGGIAKLVGIVACLSGAVILAFYKGPQLELFRHDHRILLGYPNNNHNHNETTLHDHSRTTWIKGCFLMLLATTLWALWLLLQGFVIKDYPSKLLMTTLQCLLSSIQSFGIAIAVERDMHQWKLGWNVRLLAVAYCGIMVTGVTFYLQAWVVEKKGAVFLAMATPLALIITIIFSALVLGEIISLGSILGALLLVMGLYSVLWAKKREQIPKPSCDVEEHAPP